MGALLVASQEVSTAAVISSASCPIAYFVTDQWLSNFVYRTPMNALVFVIAAVSVIAMPY